jgi:hypothetical protein
MSTFSLSDTIIADLQVIARDLGHQVFTFKGQDYECIPSSRGKSDILGEGGFGIDADLSLTVLKELFTDGVYPLSQQRLTYKGVDYRILTVKQESTDGFIKLLCADTGRGL